MSWKRSYGHKDKSHSAICNVFRRFGYSVAETQGQSGFVDAVVSKDKTCVIEIKSGKSAKVSITQLEFLSSWSGMAAIVADAESAEKLALDLHGRCLSMRQKSVLTQFCVKERFGGADDEKLYSVGRILKLIGV